jgi:hypothetical protein
VIANAGQAAGVLPIPNQLGSRTCPPPGRHAHLPAAQLNRERLLVHEASAPRGPGGDACCPRYARSHGRACPHRQRKRPHPSSPCTGLTCHLGYWWRFISLLNGVRIVAIDFAVTA